MVDLAPARGRGLGCVLQRRLDLVPALDRDGVHPGTPHPGVGAQAGKTAVVHGHLEDMALCVEQHDQVAGGFHQPYRRLRVKVTDEQVVRHQVLTK